MDKIVLVHGTNGDHSHILKSGLLPRHKTKRKANHKKVPSNRYCVYFSDTYAPYYAMATNVDNKPLLFIKAQLNTCNLYPDEDYLFQANTSRSLGYYKQNLKSFHPYWKSSLQALGTVAHWGPVPTEDILEIWRWNGPNILTVCDPSITFLNKTLLGDYYKTMTNWFAGCNDTPKGFYANPNMSKWFHNNKKHRELIYKKEN